VPGNEEILEALAEFARDLDRLGVERAGPSDLPALLERVGPDVVVDAAPGEPVATPVPWPTLGIEAALTGGLPGEAPERLTVIGSGYAAVEVAIRLAEDGHAVTVLSDQHRLGRDTHPQLAYRAAERLEERGGRVVTGVTPALLASLMFARAAGGPVVQVGGGPVVQVGDFDRAVLALGWSDLPRLAPDDVGHLPYHHVGDVYTPWDQRFVAERGAELGLALCRQTRPPRRASACSRPR
jgi:hypothetical protein